VLEDLGMRLVLWNRMPCDFLPEVTAAWMESFLRKRLRGGDILVLHDNHKTAGRIDGYIRALRKVLDEKHLSAAPL
jgi:transposase